MSIKRCVSCNNESYLAFKKQETEYYQCSFCKTLFSDPLPNDNMVGGGFEVERNTLQNMERIQRFNYLCGGQINGNSILDYGCGHGYLVKDLLSIGVDATGYDKYNQEFNTLPFDKRYNVVSMVEVIEHLSAPFEELDRINDLLVWNGFLILETSFVDVAEEERIPLEEYNYISPEVGHSTIFSHFGLDVLMLQKGFHPRNHINRHVRVYKKVR